MGEFASREGSYSQSHASFTKTQHIEVTRTRSELASDAAHTSAREVASLAHSIDLVRQATSANDVVAWKDARAALDRNLASAEQALDSAQARAHDAAAETRAELTALTRLFDEAKTSAATLTTAPSGWSPSVREVEILAVLRAPIAGPAKAGYEQKEQALRAELAQLDPVESAALGARLRKPHSGDPIAAEVARMIPERRARVLSFLSAARRRAAVSSTRGGGITAAAKPPTTASSAAPSPQVHNALMASQPAIHSTSSMVPDLHSLAAAEPRHIGNTTQVDTEHPTESEAVNSGGRSHADFLTEAQRKELDRQNTYRLTGAARNYALALKTLEIEQLIKKPDDLGFMLTLLLGVAESLLTSYGGAAIKLLCQPGATREAIQEIDHGAARAAAKAAATEAASTTDQVATTAKKSIEEAGKEAESSIKTLTEVQLNTMLKTSLTAGKKAASSGLNPATSNESHDAAVKAQSNSFIGQLRKGGDVAFDRLDQDIATVSDGMALTWWRALAPENQSEESYTARMHQKLDRYIASPVSKIGRSMDWEPGAMGSPKHVEKEVRIVRVLVPAYGVRYAAQDSVFDGFLRDHPGTTERSPAYDAASGALSLAEDATWSVGGKEERRHETRVRPDKILNFIEPEFEELARQKQEKTWQSGIETYQMTFVHGRPQLVKVAGTW